MKKLWKLLLPVMILALLVGALTFTAMAEEATQAEEAGDYFTVQVGDGEVVSYSSSDITSLGTNVGTQGQKTVINLLNDCTWGASSIYISHEVVLNLNGHTLNMNPSGSAYRFEFESSADFTVEGSGKIASTTTAARFYSGNSISSRITFNNVSFEAISSLFDVRKGTYELNNCTVTYTGNNGTPFNFGAVADADLLFEFNDTDIISTAASNSQSIFQYGRWNAFGGKVTVNYNGGTITTNGTVLFLANTPDGSSGTPTADGHKINLNGVNVNAPNARLVNVKSLKSDSVFTLGNGTVLNVAGITPIEGTVEVNIAEGCVAAGIDGTDLTKIIPEEEAYKLSVFTDTSASQPIAVRYLADGTVPTYWTGVDYHYYTEGGMMGYPAATPLLDAEGNAPIATDTDVALYLSGEASKVYYACYGKGVARTLYMGEDIGGVTRVPVYLSYVENIRDVFRKGEYGVAYENVTFYSYNEADHFGAVAVYSDVTVDLNGKTLTMSIDTTVGTAEVTYPSDSCFAVGNNGILTIKNGTVDTVNVKLAYPSNNTNGVLILEDLTVNSANAFYIIDGRGGDMTIRNTVINVTHTSTAESVMAFGNGNSTSQNPTLTIDGLTINNSSSKRKYAIRQGNSTSTKAYVFNINNLTLNGAAYTTSAISITAANSATVTMTNSHLSSAVPAILSMAKPSVVDVSLSGVYFASREAVSSFSGSVKSINDGRTVYCGITATPYVYTNEYATYTFTFKGESLSTVYTVPGVKPLLDGVLIKPVNNVSTVYYLDDAQGWVNENVSALNAGESATHEVDYTLAVYGIFTSDGSYQSHGTENTVGRGFLTGVQTSGSFILYQDLYVSDMVLNSDKTASDNAGITVSASHVTLNLNDHTLDLTAENAYLEGYESVKNGKIRFDVSRTFNVINGTIKNDHNILYADNVNDKLTFRNVNIECSSTPFDMRVGTLTLDNCNVKATGSTMLSFYYRNYGAITVNINGGTYNAHTLFSSSNIENKTGEPDAKINVNGATFDFTGYLLSLQPTIGGGKLEINFTGCHIKAKPVAHYKTEGALISVDVTFSDCYLNFDPLKPAFSASSVAENKAAVNVSVGEGERVLLSSDEVYGYRVMAVKLPVSANLTLYSDVNLNLFLDKSVTQVLANGEALTLVEYDSETLKAIAKSISPAKAAEPIVFTISFVEGEVTYTVDFSYSIIAYADSLLRTEAEDKLGAKPLVAALVDYISKAYAYDEEATAPEALTTLLGMDYYLDNLPQQATEYVSSANTDELAAAIDSARFALSSECFYRLTIKEGFNGTLTVNGNRCVIKNGLYGDKSYVDIKLPARHFNEGLTITATDGNGSYSGSYDLAAYVNSVAGAEEPEAALLELVKALYSYAYQASLYTYQS